MIGSIEFFMEGVRSGQESYFSCIWEAFSHMATLTSTQQGGGIFII